MANPGLKFGRVLPTFSMSAFNASRSTLEFDKSVNVYKFYSELKFSALQQTTRKRGND